MLNQNIGILGPNGQLLEKKDVCEDNNLIPCLANDEYNEFGIDQLSNTNLICSICGYILLLINHLYFYLINVYLSDINICTYGYTQAMRSFPAKRL